jgi:hypothetical protein
MKTTKTLLMAATLCLGLGACTAGYQANLSERISDVPTQPHQQDVDLFFTGEWPKEEYVKVAALEVRGGETTRYADLIKQLKVKAQLYGADAVVVQEKGYISDVSSTNTNRAVGTLTTSELHGIAVKYKKNLDLGQMPKLQQVQVYNSETKAYEPALNLQLAYNGDIEKREELKPDAINFYNGYIKPYSKFHLLDEYSPYWTQIVQKGYVVARQLVRNGTTLKEVKVEYTPDHKIKKIYIEEQGKAKEYINYTYDSNGNMLARHIYRDNVLILTEKYTYSTAGQVEQVNLFAKEQQGEKPLLQSTFAYYTLAEVK